MSMGETPALRAGGRAAADRSGELAAARGATAAEPAPAAPLRGPRPAADPAASERENAATTLDLGALMREQAKEGGVLWNVVAMSFWIHIWFCKYFSVLIEN